MHGNQQRLCRRVSYCVHAHITDHADGWRYAQVGVGWVRGFSRVVQYLVGPL